MLCQYQASPNLIGDFKRWLNINNINLRFVEELFKFDIEKNREKYSSAELQFFVIVKYYICCKTHQPPPIHSS